MTNTDQAFIQAYQRSQASAAPKPTPDPSRQEMPRPAAPPAPVESRVAASHGPHLMWREKTPLAEAIAWRMRRAGASPSATPPTMRLRSFAWPGVVTQLALAHAADYEALAPSPGIGQTIGIAGIHQGSGATTTTLALARCLARRHGPVAVVDADPAGAGLAASLGVLQTRTLAETIAGGGPVTDAMLHANSDKVSLVVIGNTLATPIELLAAAANQISECCPVVLIDFGSPLDSRDAWQSGSVAPLIAAFNPAGLVLVRCDSDLSGAVSAAQRVIEAAGSAALGVIENRLGSND